MITITKLRKTYGARTAVDDLSFGFAAGGVTGSPDPTAPETPLRHPWPRTGPPTAESVHPPAPTADGLDTIEQAVADIAAGKAVVVVDDEDRENEGDLIFAAEKATPDLVAFMTRYTSGYICVPMTGEELDRLEIPLMVGTNQERMRTAYAVTVDARTGISTGISAADRARTMHVLSDPATTPYDLTRPGHINPLRALEGGVLRRAGTPRQRSTCAASRGCARSVSSARSSARRTATTWPASMS